MAVGACTLSSKLLPAFLVAAAVSGTLAAPGAAAGPFCGSSGGVQAGTLAAAAAHRGMLAGPQHLTTVVCCCVRVFRACLFLTLLPGERDFVAGC